jgi:hypothetical protein
MLQPIEKHPASMIQEHERIIFLFHIDDFNKEMVDIIGYAKHCLSKKLHDHILNFMSQCNLNLNLQL